jgi:hypothetical protein
VSRILVNPFTHDEPDDPDDDDDDDDEDDDEESLGRELLKAVTVASAAAFIAAGAEWAFGELKDWAVQMKKARRARDARRGKARKGRKRRGHDGAP